MDKKRYPRAIRMTFGRLRALLRETISGEIPQDRSLPVEPVFGTFTPWPPEVLALGPASYAKSEGVGPGERWAAALLNGQVMGGGSTYDIKSPYGLFEVKEPHGGILTGEIKTEAKGIAAMGPALSRMRDVIKTLGDVFGPEASDAVRSAIDETFSTEQVQRIVDFLYLPDKGGQSSGQWIMRGEISTDRLRRLAETLRIVVAGLSKTVTEEKYVTMGDVESGSSERFVVDDTTFDEVMNIITSPSDPLYVLDVALDDEAFRSSESFIKDVIANGARPSDAFSGVDGLVMVTPKGYLILPQDSLDERLRFLRVSKGKPYFRLRH